jgi:hypothetical protein
MKKCNIKYWRLHSLILNFPKCLKKLKVKFKKKSILSGTFTTFVPKFLTNISKRSSEVLIEKMHLKH